mmetsp:Transcript_2448/g.6089  ORF Transcript_2448/g.6089 Transcript_2448/m.6089 type:complete len:509 (-) Transcript_2448:45-1571(-)
MSTPLARHPSLGWKKKEQLLKASVSFNHEVVELVCEDVHEEDDEKRVCRICKTSGRQKLIHPCVCGHPHKWVHRHCLNKQRVDTRFPRNFSYCPQCAFMYRMTLRRPPSQDGTSLKERRRAFVKQIVKNSLLSFLMVQVWFLLLSLVLARGHGVQHVLQFFGLSARLGENHHKAAAYCLAILVTMFVLVVGGVAILALATLKACRDKCVRSIWPDDGFDDRSFQDGAFPDDALGVAAQDSSYCPCESARFNCHMLCLDQPKIEVPWLAGLKNVVANACWHSNAGVNDEGVEEALTDSHLLETGGGGGGSSEIDYMDVDADADTQDEMVGWAFIVSIAVAVFLVVVGLIVFFIFAGLWLQKVVVKYLQLVELQELAHEYEVEDISRKQAVHEDDEYLPSKLEDPRQEIVLVEQRDGRRSSTVSMTRETINASLMHDLTFLYGYEVTPPLASRTVSSVTRSVATGMRSVSLASMASTPVQSQGNGGSASSLFAFRRMGSTSDRIRAARSV